MARDDGSEPKSIVEEFDTRVASFWLVIMLGVSKTIEQMVLKTSEYVVTIHVFHIDLTVMALYAGLAMLGITMLIAVRAIRR